MTSQAPQTDPAAAPMPAGATRVAPGATPMAPGATPAVEAASAPATQVPQGRTSTHSRGNWRSLIISMVVMAALLIALVALRPTPQARERATADAERSATQVAQQTGWPVATADLGEGWHATSVGYQPDEKGIPTWQVGYHSRPGDQQYVVLDQTKPGADVTPDALTAWVERAAQGGPASGTSTVDGQVWQRRSAQLEGGDGHRVHRALVATGQAAPEGLATVVSGEDDWATLESVAAKLTPHGGNRGLQPSASASSISSSISSGASPASSGSSSAS